MPIVATHFISGVAVTALLFWRFRDRLEPRWLWLAFPFLFIMPDVDHLLYWQPSMLGLILPLSLGDLFAGMFGPRPPSYLHNWFIPVGLLALGLYPKITDGRVRFVLLVAALAWATHMLMDGVLLW
jgi:hypothetical protein